MTTFGRAAMKRGASHAEVLRYGGNVYYIRFTTVAGKARFVTQEEVTVYPPNVVTYRHLAGPLDDVYEVFTALSLAATLTCINYMGQYRNRRFDWPLLGGLIHRFHVLPMYDRIIATHLADVKRRAEAASAPGAAVAHGASLQPAAGDDGFSQTAPSNDAERLRRYWDQHARSYDREMAFLERVLFGDGRAWVCSQAAGDVLEVAIGTGRNLPFYPQDVRLTGVDFSPTMLALARRRAEQLGRKVELQQGDAQALRFPDAAFDTVVCTLSLCGIPDDRRAIAEMRRVLRPGGRLLLLDHVAGRPAWVRVLQWLIERATIPMGGEHLRRRPLVQVRAAGFAIERRKRAKLGIVERLVARKVSGPVA